MLKRFYNFLAFPLEVTKMIIFYLPGKLGNRLRYAYWKRRLKFLGDNVKIDVGVYIQNPEYVSIGNNCWIDRHVILVAGPDKSGRSRKILRNDQFKISKGEVRIGSNIHIGSFCIISGIGGVYLGDYCGFSAGVKVYSFSHHYRSFDHPDEQEIFFGSMAKLKNQFMIEGPVVLGRNVGVGLNAVILPGVSIGENSFVAIGSVVMASFDENCFISGAPAKSKKKRFG
jgi:acetyltransferase-like isoleucine patch superfamily enzyme